MTANQLAQWKSPNNNNNYLIKGLLNYFVALLSTTNTIFVPVSGGRTAQFKFKVYFFFLFILYIFIV